MVPLIITILLGLVSSSIQKSSNSDEPQEAPELQTILQNLVNKGNGKYYKDVNLKLNRNKNKKRALEDDSQVQYVGELSYEKEQGFNNLNKKLAKLLDGMQQQVLDDKITDPTCSCDFASKSLPGVIKCQCGDSLNEGVERSKENYKKDDFGHDEDFQEHYRLDENRGDDVNEREPDKNWLREFKYNQKHKNIRKDRSFDEDYEYWQLSRFSKDEDRDDDLDDSDQSAVNACGCKLLRIGDGEERMKYIRCSCNYPARSENNRQDDRDGAYSSYSDGDCKCGYFGETHPRCKCSSISRIGKDIDDGYWSDDNWCPCKLLRNVEDAGDVKYLQCACDSPGRIGDDKEDDENESFRMEETRCGCKQLRTMGDDEDEDVRYLRCRCNSPGRWRDVKEDNRVKNYWMDDTARCGCKWLRNINDDNDDEITYLRCRCNSPTRAGKVIDDGYWSDDNYCPCKLLRDNESDDDKVSLRCRCNSPTRIGKDVNDGYWSDDNWCPCKLLRDDDENDDKLNLRCRCNSPTRIGKDVNDGYWSDDNWCPCKLLRDDDENDDKLYLRCRCNSLSPRAGRNGNGFRVSYDSKRPDELDALSDLNDDIDTNSNNKPVKTGYRSTVGSNSDDPDMQTLIKFILKKENNVDLSPKQKEKLLLKLKNIVPSLRNVRPNRLGVQISSLFNEVNPLRKKEHNSVTSLTVKQRQRLLRLIEQQKKTANDDNPMYRRSMPEDIVGVPFTYEVEGLAQINT